MYLRYWDWNAYDPYWRPWQRGSVGDVTAQNASASQDSTGFGFGFEVPRTRQAGWLVSDVISLARLAGAPSGRLRREA
jgi:hypothetical protein